MTNEEQNRVMDQFFEHNRHHVPLVSPQEMGAIRECDRKARAWDELYEWVQRSDVKMDLVKAAMDGFLAPTPKDKLERLEEKVLSLKATSLVKVNCDHLILANDVLAEIRRLKEEK